jgi:ureidoglycolate dehydrogenase (NAD+)
VHADTPIIAPETLREFSTRLLLAAGLNEADAHLTADTLVEANLRGTDSHGVARLPHYLKRLALGSINPKPRMVYERLAPSTGRLDGDHALGQVVMNRAAAEVLLLARETGAGWVAARNSSHCGALAYYGLRLAAAGLLGLVFSHTDSIVLPYGGRRPFCGTNPVCLTAPGQGGQCLCLDMATSVVAWNRIANAALTGESVPLGWIMDADGRDTTDPNAVAALYPVGAYKGSGLGLLIDVFCALLTESPYGPDIPLMFSGLEQHRRLGGLVGAIDIARFLPVDRFQVRLSELIQRWNSLPPAGPGAQVLYPGQPEVLTRERRLREGIPLPRWLIAVFDQCCQEHKLGFTLTDWLARA